MRITKRKILKEIASASVQDLLGFFVGSGLAKAVLGEDKALSWIELLQKCADRMRIPEYEKNRLFGEECKSRKERISPVYLDCPKIASEICNLYSQNLSKTNKNSKSNKSNIAAEKIFKQVVAEQIAGYILPDKESGYRAYLKKMNPQWFITTNYDLLIESLFDGATIDLLPSNSFIKVKNLIPVCHIHGSIKDPSSIVITQNDYIEFFRAGNYWQNRLPFLIKEYMMLMIGYNLGDANIISALDWAGSVYKNNEFQYPIILVNHTDNPRKKPYTRKYKRFSIRIIDTDNLGKFFTEVMEAIDREKDERNNLIKKIDSLEETFKNKRKEDINNVIYNKEERGKLLSFMKSLSSEHNAIWPSFLDFYKSVLKDVQVYSHINGNFNGYALWLEVLLDTGETIDVNKMSPDFFKVYYENSKEIAWYIQLNCKKIKGTSYAASRIWKDRHSKIPRPLQERLYLYTTADFSNDFSSFSLRSLLLDSFTNLRSDFPIASSNDIIWDSFGI